jgi:hypothetical protein
MGHWEKAGLLGSAKHSSSVKKVHSHCPSPKEESNEKMLESVLKWGSLSFEEGSGK